ncbi:MAG: PAS domain-containing sensor histidine kinase, partial [Gemmatimonadetes bacterium]|nr:PAS domain-containing sensor histidine kinase [Gemmatimonadota bacterium]
RLFRRAVVENAADAIVTIDADDRIVFANPAAVRIFGYGHGDLRGMDACGLFADGLRPAADSGDGGGGSVRLTGVHRTGREIPLEATFGVFREEGRQLVTAVMRDISDRVRMEQEHARLQESKARLIRGFGHDVKNPLGAADGYAALLEDGIYGPMPEKQQQAVGRIRRSIGTALGLIRELVEFSKAEAGELNVEFQDVDLHTLLCEVAEDHRAAARTAGLVLEFDGLRSLPQVSADPVRVRQVLGNLLSNAIKYTPAGGSIRMTARVCEEDGGGLEIAIEDTGIGIPPEQQERLFQEFTRINPGATEGAGLGLAISRRIARALGGDITVKSAVGQGSTFTLRLPPNHSAAGAASESTASDGALSSSGA